MEPSPDWCNLRLFSFKWVRSFSLGNCCLVLEHRKIPVSQWNLSVWNQNIEVFMCSVGMLEYYAVIGSASERLMLREALYGYNKYNTNIHVWHYNSPVLMMVLCPKGGSLAFTPPGDEMSEVVSRCVPHRQLWVHSNPKCEPEVFTVEEGRVLVMRA